MRDINIVVYGDSIAWGAYDLEEGGWVERLKKYFLNKCPEEVFVYNRAVSGDITENILKRFDAVKKFQIIIFAVGVNDSMYFSVTEKSRVSIQIFKENVRKLAQKAKKLTKNVIFIGLAPVDEKLTLPLSWDNSGRCLANEIVRKYDKAIEEVCEEEKVNYIFIFDSLDQDDLGIESHPNAQGHKKIFEKVKSFLLEKKLV